MAKTSNGRILNLSEYSEPKIRAVDVRRSRVRSEIKGFFKKSST
jgi:hypothetical protein